MDAVRRNAQTTTLSSFLMQIPFHLAPPPLLLKNPCKLPRTAMPLPLADAAAAQQHTHRRIPGPATPTRGLGPHLLPARPVRQPLGRMAAQRRATTAPPSRTPVDLIGEAFSSRTTRKHVALLAELEQFVSARTARTSQFPQHALAAAEPLKLSPAILAEYLEMRRLNPRGRTRSGPACKWSTQRTLLGSILGAIRDAPLHSSRLTMTPNDPSVRKIERTIDHRVYSEQTQFPFAATPAHVETALKHLDTLPLPPFLILLCKVYLLIWWATAARSGDALLLQEWAIRSLRSSHGRPIHSIKFVEGKGVKLRGPYTVHTLVPHPELLQSVLNASSGYIFPPQLRETIQTTVMAALKHADPRLEARSIRRGSLQALAMADTDEATLMVFSGHKCLHTLHRYLDWGMMRGLAQQAGGNAAFAAWAPLLRRRPCAGSASQSF